MTKTRTTIPDLGKLRRPHPNRHPSTKSFASAMSSTCPLHTRHPWQDVLTHLWTDATEQGKIFGVCRLLHWPEWMSTMAKKRMAGITSRHEIYYNPQSHFSHQAQNKDLCKVGQGRRHFRSWTLAARLLLRRRRDHLKGAHPLEPTRMLQGDQGIVCAYAVQANVPVDSPETRKKRSVKDAHAVQEQVFPPPISSASVQWILTGSSFGESTGQNSSKRESRAQAGFEGRLFRRGHIARSGCLKTSSNKHNGMLILLPANLSPRQPRLESSTSLDALRGSVDIRSPLSRTTRSRRADTPSSIAEIDSVPKRDPDDHARKIPSLPGSKRPKTQVQSQKRPTAASHPTPISLPTTRS